MEPKVKPGTNPEPIPATIVVNGNPEGTPAPGSGGSAAANPEAAPVGAPVNPGEATPIMVNPGTGQPVVTPTPEPGPSGAVPKDNAAFASMRVENRQLKDTVGTLQTQMAGITSALQNIGNPAVGPGIQPEGIPIEKRLVEDPVGTIREIAVSAFQEANNKQTFQTKVSQSRKTVLDRYPQLTNPESEEYKLYNQVCADNPDYFNLGNGPLVAMREMEDRISAAGKAPATMNGAAPEGQFVPEAVAPNPNPAGGVMLDPARMVRPNPGVIMKANGIQITPGAAVALSPAQNEYCRRNGIDPKVYGQIINKTGNGGYTA